MIRSFRGITPKIAPSCYIDPSAQLIGDIVIGENSSVWPNATIRGDVHYIRIGDTTSVQDNSVLHVEHQKHPLIIPGITLLPIARCDSVEWNFLDGKFCAVHGYSVKNRR